MLLSSTFMLKSALSGELDCVHVYNASKLEAAK